MVKVLDLPEVLAEPLASYRLVSSKFPPIALFDDVARAEDFEVLYQLQALTNPRLLAQAGELGLIPKEEIPFGIPGCSYAVAPFTHVTPDGSRFSDGSYGVLYLADSMDTAIAEVHHHQQDYLSRVEGLRYDRLVFRGLLCHFSERLLDATILPSEHPIYDPEDYHQSRAWGMAAREQGAGGLTYRSVRHPGNNCWALFTPRGVQSIVQTAHFEMIWDGQMISSVSQVSQRDGH